MDGADKAVTVLLGLAVGFLGIIIMMIIGIFGGGSLEAGSSIYWGMYLCCVVIACTRTIIFEINDLKVRDDSSEKDQ